MRAGALGVAICLSAGLAAAQERPAEGTVLIRVVGHITAALSDESGISREKVELSDVEIGTGSGMIVSPFGYVVTNYHVIAGGELKGRIRGIPATVTLDVQRIEVRLPGSGTERPAVARHDASVVATDPEMDLAILLIPGNDFPYVPFGDSDALETGESASVVGYPLGEALDLGRGSPDDPTAPAMTTGIVSALRRDGQGNIRFIQTSAPVNRGNSGGPLLDRDGFAAGVVQLKANADAIGFAIPINLVKDVLARNGVDTFLPTARLTAGHYYDAPQKLMRFMVPATFQDAGASRLDVDSGSSLPGLSLRVDRVAAPWTLEQLENELLSGRAFEQVPSTRVGTPARDDRTLRGEATGRASGGPFRVLYALMDLGNEKVVARYIGTAESIAFNESVLKASLATLEARPMLSGANAGAIEAGWTAVSAPGWQGIVNVIPSGWTLDGGAPIPCRDLPAPRQSLVASPQHDFTVSVRVGQYDPLVDIAQAAAHCGRGASSNGSYRYTFSRFGIAYAVEGLFRPAGSRVVQMEIVAPSSRLARMRDVFARLLTEFSAASK